MRGAGIGFALCAAIASPAAARGLFLEEAPWNRPATADSILQIDFGATVADGDTSGFLLGATLTPIRRGALRLAFTWSWVSVHTVAGRAFGLGDPKVFVRLRAVGRDSSFAAAFVEGMARLPVADPDLFPFASGGQELEASGTLALGHRRGTRLGAGYIWSEPPSGGHLHAADVPHALHVWGSQALFMGDWVLRGRADVLRMQLGSSVGPDSTSASVDGPVVWRQQFEASITRRAPMSLHPTLAAGFEFGPDADRAVDAYVTLRFAMPLR